MKPVPQKNDVRKRAAAARNASQRKKLIIAVVLLAVMGILWLRLFVGKGKPRAVSAAASSTEISAVSVAAPAGDNVTFINLPVIPERHNVLANDFFDAKLFKGFGTNDSGNTNEIIDSKSDAGNSGAVNAAVEAMELVAIVNDKKPQAFIEDKLLEEGQTFRFVFHDQNYEFKVVKIHSDKVELECGGAIITKRIPESSFRSEQ